MREHKGYLYRAGWRTTVSAASSSTAPIRPGPDTRPTGAPSSVTREFESWVFFTYFLRDMEQILFPNREQHAIPSMDGALSPKRPAWMPAARLASRSPEPTTWSRAATARSMFPAAGRWLRLAGEGYSERSVFAAFDGNVPAALAFHPDGRLLVCVAGRGLAAVDGAGRQSCSTRSPTSRSTASPASSPALMAASS